MKSFVNFILFTCFGISAVTAQSFYDINSIQEIKVNFYQTNWQHLLDSLKDVPGNNYLLVPSVEINGQVFDSVGVKYKGYSSYNPNNLKNPIHIDLDHFKKGQKYLGVEHIKLSNSYYDPTFVREVLSYEILRKYMDEPLANYAKVWLDGEYWGVYVNVESIDRPFLRKHFHTDGDNPFFKCNPTDVSGTNAHSDLKYDEDHPDSVWYYPKYELKSDYGWAQLLTLMDTLTNFPSQVHNVIDVDRALWMLAFNDVFVNLDSYTGLFAQNYYLYLDKNKRWLPIVWDLNLSFGGFNNLNGSSLMNLHEMQELDPLAQSQNDFRPLIKSLLANPTYKRMYLAHLRTILQENFSTMSLYRPRALALQAMINTAVLADTKKFYSDAEFVSNIDQTINPNDVNHIIPGLTELMSGRNSFLLNNPELTPTPPSIINISTALQAGEIHVTASVLNGTSVILAYRYDSSEIFQKLQMFDDGQHSDGMANDGKYGQSFIYNGLVTQFYIYAENANAGIFSPHRAEHVFYTINVDQPITNFSDIVINEFLANNVNSETDEAGQYEDWIELYNNSDVEISMNGLYLTDDSLIPDKWLFPLGTTIPSKGFLIIWADEDQSQGPLHANFKLNREGEFLMLSNGAGGVVDSLSYGPQRVDTTFGRYPNGTGPFVYMLRTFNANNSSAVSANEPEQDASLQIYPNPVSSIFTVKSDHPLGILQLTDAMGRQIIQTDAGNAEFASLDLRQAPEGIYFLKIGGRAARLICVRR